MGAGSSDHSQLPREDGCTGYRGPGRVCEDDAKWGDAGVAGCVGRPECMVGRKWSHFTKGAPKNGAKIEKWRQKVEHLYRGEIFSI